MRATNCTAHRNKYDRDGVVMRWLDIPADLQQNHAYEHDIAAKAKL